MKYWVLAVKLKEIINSTNDSKFDLKANILYFFVIFWIIAAVSLYTFVYVWSLNGNLQSKLIWIASCVFIGIVPVLILVFFTIAMRIFA